MSEEVRLNGFLEMFPSKSAHQVLVAISTLVLWSLLVTDTQSAEVRTGNSGSWADGSTWERGRGPEAGDVVLIRPGHRVIYDVASETPIRAIHVGGVLTFSREKDTLLCAGLIRIAPGEECKEEGFDCHAKLSDMANESERPALEVGLPGEPIPPERTAIIRLTYIEGMDKQSFPAVVCCGGRMDFHGAPVERTWQKLGYQTPILEHQVIPMPKLPEGWRVGDRLLFPGTGQTSPVNERIIDVKMGHLLMRDASHSEVRTLIKGQDWGFLSNLQLVGLDAPLKYNHDVFERWQGEVANLSRNVVVESADPKGERGHTMYHRGSRGSLSYVEFRHLGKPGILGRYPVHFHLTGDTMRGSSVVGCSVWDSANRAITLHGTHYLVVRDNVVFDIQGHAFFLEDGTETRNVVDRNLACLVHEAEPLPDQTLAFDMNTGAGFWWANSLNVFTRNVAVECDHDGFRFEAIRVKDTLPRALVRQPDGSTAMKDLRTIPFIRFEQNEAHRMRLFGLNLNGLSSPPDTAAVRLKELGAAEDAEGVGPDLYHALRVADFRCWDAHWAFHGGATNVEIDGLDVFRTVHGLWRPMGAGQMWNRFRFEMVDSAIIFPRWHPTEAYSKGVRRYESEEEIVDDLPPSVTITTIQPLAEGRIRVLGVVAEDGTTKSVTVNGQAAKSTRAEFAEWETVIKAPDDGPVVAVAEDTSGLRELVPHEVQVSSSGSAKQR